MPPYLTESFPKNNLMRIVLHKNGPEQDWDDISSMFKTRAGEGVTNWELDIRPIAFIDSLTLGNIVALSTSAKARGGSFRLLIRKESEIARLVRLTRLNRIIDVMENMAN